LLDVALNALKAIEAQLVLQSSYASQAKSEISIESRAYLQASFTKATAEIDRLVSTTTFNGVTLLDGSLDTDEEPLTLQLGPTAQDQFTLEIPDVASDALYESTTPALTTVATATTAETTITTAREILAEVIGKVEGTRARVDDASAALSFRLGGSEAGSQAIAGTRVPEESLFRQALEVQFSAATAITAQAALLPTNLLQLLVLPTAAPAA
jgi:flagellin